MWVILMSLFAEPCLAAAEVEYVARVWNPPAAYPATLRDIASRLPPDTDAKEPCLITYAHEGAHFLCKGKEGYHGIYVGDGIRIYIPSPPLNTALVLAAVPAEKRGAIYQTYLRQGMTEYWSTRPLMILDEWNAYLHGCRTRRESTVESRRETTVHCATFATYAAVLYEMARECDGYPHKELKDFCNYQLARCREVIPDWDELTDAKFD